MRVRKRDNRKGTTSITIVDTPGGTSSTITPFGWSGEYQEIQDEVHANYRAAVKSGGVVLGNLYLYKTRREGTSASCSFGSHPSWGSRTVTGDLTGYIAALDPIGDLASTKALMDSGSLVKAFAKMNESKVMTGELLNDFTKTVQMLRHPFKSSIQLTKKILSKKNKLLGRSRTITSAKAFSDAWLEYRYGWRPIIMDVNSIMESVANCTRSRPRNLVARASTSYQTSKSVPCSGAPSCINGGITGTATFSRKVRSSSGVIYRVEDNVDHDSALTTYGLRGRDIPATLWEVIPYSFVVDWFIGVGDWLQAITPSPGIRVLGNWTTTVDESINSFTDLVATLSVATAPAATYKCTVSPSKTTSVLVTRVCGSGLPTTPVPSVNLLSVTQSISGASLLCQQLVAGLRGARR